MDDPSSAQVRTPPYQYITNQALRLLRENEDANVAFANMVMAVLRAGIEVFGRERASELVRNALEA
jgi:hypothetical protein